MSEMDGHNGNGPDGTQQHLNLVEPVPSGTARSRGIEHGAEPHRGEVDTHGEAIPHHGVCGQYC